MFGFKSYAAALAATLTLGLATPPAWAVASPDGADTPDARPAASPAPAPDKAGALALTLVQALAQGSLDRTLLAPALNAELGDDALAGYRSALAEFGKPLHVRLRARYREDTRISYVYRIYYTTATADLTFAVDDGTGKLSVLYLRGGPPVQP